MTRAQARYLKTLCDKAGKACDPERTNAEASQRIDARRATTPRGP